MPSRPVRVAALLCRATRSKEATWRPSNTFASGITVRRWRRGCGPAGRDPRDRVLCEIDLAEERMSVASAGAACSTILLRRLRRLRSRNRRPRPAAPRRQVERVDVTQFFSDATRELLRVRRRPRSSGAASTSTATTCSTPRSRTTWSGTCCAGRRRPGGDRRAGRRRRRSAASDGRRRRRFAGRQARPLLRRIRRIAGAGGVYVGPSTCCLRSP
jgi:hypothetical protein